MNMITCVRMAGWINAYTNEIFILCTTISCCCCLLSLFVFIYFANIITKQSTELAVCLSDCWLAG